MKLHVGNLAAGTTAQALRDAFAPYGKVVAVTLPSTGMHQGKARGAHRGYAFVAMPDPSQARAAVAALHQRPLGGQAVTVQAARIPSLLRRRAR
jgi:RNA recognition motif-containing protein